MNDRPTGEIEYYSIHPSWPNPMQLCALGKLVREKLGTFRACPCFIRLCRRQANDRLELPGGPYAHAEEISCHGGACGATPRTTSVFAEYAERDGEG